MLKLLLQHAAALGAAVVFGAMFAVGVIEALLPPVPPGFIPRPVAVAFYAAWIAGGAYLIIGSTMALRRWRKGRPDPMAVVTPALFSTWGVVVVLALVLCVIDRSHHL